MTERVWLIAAMSSGIGLALAKEVLNRGDLVIGTTRDGHPPSDLVSEVNLTTMALDILERDRVAQVVEAAHAVHGRLDVVVCNVDRGLSGPIEELTPEQANHIFAVNFFGPFDLVRSALHLLRRQAASHIVVISSIAGLVPSGGLAIYAASKFALEGLSQSLAEEVAPSGIWLTVVEPGESFFPELRSHRTEHYALDVALGSHAGFAADPPTADLDKAASAVIAAVQADEPPLNLILGSDAIRRVATRLNRFDENMNSWKTVSLSTDKRPAHSIVSNEMKAIGFYRALPLSEPESLVDCEIPLPELRPRDLLVRIEAISVNPADVKIRATAQVPAGAPRILGYDAVGIVVATGSEAELFKAGDAVFYAGAMDRPGTNAEFHAVDERIVGRKPSSLSVAQAAALPLTSLTAWELLFDRLAVPCGRKTADDAILIVNGAGGVGSILTQIARRLTGLTVITTASRSETIAWSKKMGAHFVIDHHRPLNEGLKEIGIPQVRYVASLTATDKHQKAIVDSLAPQGALAMIDDPQTFDVVPFKLKCLSVHWELMFTRSLFNTPDIAQQGQVLNEISELVDSGLLRTTLHEDFGPINVGNLKRAHAAVEAGRGIGKIVLSEFEHV